MSKIADITFENGVYKLKGDLDFSNVMSLYQSSLAHIDGCDALRFDFSQVGTSNSSGLALIIEWIKLAAEKQKPVQFTGVSEKLQAIAKAAGLSDIITHH